MCVCACVWGAPHTARGTPAELGVFARGQIARTYASSNMLGQALVGSITVSGSIDVDHLATVAHKHAQRTLASYFYPDLTAHHQEQHPWTDIARISSAGSTGRGSGALANMYTIIGAAPYTYL